MCNFFGFSRYLPSIARFGPTMGTNASLEIRAHAPPICGCKPHGTAATWARRNSYVIFPIIFRRTYPSPPLCASAWAHICLFLWVSMSPSLSRRLSMVIDVRSRNTSLNVRPRHETKRGPRAWRSKLHPPFKVMLWLRTSSTLR